MIKKGQALACRNIQESNGIPHLANGFLDIPMAESHQERGMKMSNFYSPKPEEQGYFYHVEIQEQVQLTYEQYLTQENRGKEVCTSDPDDDTDYQKINWYNDIKTSFANKEWDELVKEIRNTFKRYGNVMLQQKENGTHYVYYFGRTLWLKEKVLKRASIFITHEAIIEMNQEKFMNDLTRIGRWEKN